LHLDGSQTGGVPGKHEPGSQFDGSHATLLIIAMAFAIKVDNRNAPLDFDSIPIDLIEAVFTSAFSCLSADAVLVWQLAIWHEVLLIQQV
jgi:hypothetical protein